MRRRLQGARWPVATLVAVAVALPAAAPAAADDARPTVDPSAPTPTAPYAGPPPQGSRAAPAARA